MNENVLLMDKDISVMEFNFDEGLYKILNYKYLPFQLKGRIKEAELSQNPTKYETTQYIIASQKNYDAVISYLASRVLSLSRENAKKVYNLFGLQQLQTESAKAKIAILCRAVSLQDNYWVKLKSDKTVWNDINLRNNSLSETVAMVSLHGTSLTIQGQVHTPELNGQGAYAKAWTKENGDLYLLKKGKRLSDDIDNESRLEVMISNILDKCNVPHVQYTPAFSQGQFVCKCKCMTTENLSILPGLDFISYCNVNSLNPDEEMLKIDSENIYKMWIVDYLISNSDRHGMNWGFFYNADTMDIVGCHPLYDHNNAFDKGIMENKNYPYLFNQKMSMQQAAHTAMKYVDFYFIDKIKESDFLSKEQYNSFMDRAKELGIKIKAMSRTESMDKVFKYTNYNKLNIVCAELKKNNIEYKVNQSKDYAILYTGQTGADLIHKIAQINKDINKNINNIR